MDVQLVVRRRVPLGLFLLSVAEHPTRAFARARGQRYWGPAFVLWLGVNVVWLWGTSFVNLGLAMPLVTTVLFMLTYPLTVIGRSFCDGHEELTDATASQGVLLAGLAALPAALAHQVAGPLLVLVLLVGAMVFVGCVTVSLWATAFRSTPSRALAGFVVAVVASLPLAVPLAQHTGLTAPKHHHHDICYHGCPPEAA